MSKWENTTMTQQGQDLLDALIAGTKKMNITRAVVGSGTVAATKLATQTEVTDPVQEAELGNAIISEGAVTIPVVITNTDLNTGYTAKQIGIFAQAEGEDEILFLISQSDTNGQDIPSKNEPPHGFTAEFNFTVDTGTASDLSITVNTAGLLTEARADELYLRIEDAEDIGGGGTEPVAWEKGVHIRDLGPGYFYLDAKLEEGDAAAMGLPEKYGAEWVGMYVVIRGSEDIYHYEAYIRDWYNDYLWHATLQSEITWVQIFTSETVVPIKNGGTGATNTEGALANLGGASSKEHLVRSYNSLSAIGLTIGSETIESIATNLPAWSEVFFTIGTACNSAIYPSVYGSLRVTKYGSGSDRVVFEFVRKQTLQKWIGTYDSTISVKWSGWKEIYGEHNITKGTTDIGAGSALATGCIHLVYE